MKSIYSFSIRLAALLAVCLVLHPAPLRAAIHYYPVTNLDDRAVIGGSLRWAMETAIADSDDGPIGDEYVITFNLPGSPGTVHTFRPEQQLPRITSPLTIDATTQPGYAGVPLIVISGADSLAEHGLLCSFGELKLRGLAVSWFPFGVSSTSGDGLTMTGCHIGTNAAGTAAAPNGTGISVSSRTKVRIGGTGPNEGNVISGNNDAGISLLTNQVSTPHDIQIMNNKIGTSRNGQTAIPNGSYGIFVGGASENTSSGLVIGAPGAGRNIISGNLLDGIWIRLGAVGTVVKNNFIGLAADGTTMLGNGRNGIECHASNADIGGPGLTDGNVISGNGQHGVYSRNSSAPGFPTQLRNNLIGTDAAGTAARPNGEGGVLVEQFAVIGGPGDGNVISGNTGNGVTVMGGEAHVWGNLIGVTRSIAPLGNSLAGIRILDGKALVGQAPNLANGNVIGANGSHGIVVNGASSLIAQGNYIGTTATGADVGNGGDGIQHGPFIGIGLPGTSTMGGIGPGTANSIAFNTGAGVWLPEPLGFGARYLGILGNSIWANGGLGIDLGARGVLP